MILLAALSTKKKADVTTAFSTAGNSAAGAVAILIVWAIGLAGVDVPPEVAGALVIALGALGGFIGGKKAPSKAAEANVIAERAADRAAGRVAAGVPSVDHAALADAVVAAQKKAVPGSVAVEPVASADAMTVAGVPAVGSGSSEVGSGSVSG